MKITIEPTTQIVMIKPGPLSDGVPARVWEGQSESGIKVQCLVTRIAVSKDEPRADEFEKELQEVKAPSPEVAAYPLRLIL